MLPWVKNTLSEVGTAMSPAPSSSKTRSSPNLDDGDMDAYTEREIKLTMLLEELERENLKIAADAKEAIKLREQNIESEKTIEELVNEYSKLASQFEIQRLTDETIQKDLREENEILRDRLQALEHSMMVITDRYEDNTKETDANTKVEQTTANANRQELHDTRTQLLSLQFDNKKLARELTEAKKELKEVKRNISKIVGATTSMTVENATRVEKPEPVPVSIPEPERDVESYSSSVSSLNPPRIVEGRRRLQSQDSISSELSRDTSITGGMDAMADEGPS